MEEKNLLDALAQVKRIGGLLNEALDFSKQIAEAIDRNDQVAVEMLVHMRQEPIDKMEAAEQALQEQTEAMPTPEDAARLNSLLKGSGEPPLAPFEQALTDQAAANRRRLQQILELDKRLNQRMAREKSVYQ
jgi:signal transduction histidine kinase